MLVFWKERLVFLSVPKTGTTAYENALAPLAAMSIQDPPDLKHAPIYRYNRFFRPMFEKFGADGMETLAVVREPISWLGSWYRYRRRPFVKGQKNSTHEVSFDEFVLGYLNDKPPAFANVGSQAKFLGDKESIIGVTHLFKYEALDRAREFFEERLETTLNINTLNVSPQMELELSAATRRDFERECALEYEVWSQGIG